MAPRRSERGNRDAERPLGDPQRDGLRDEGGASSAAPEPDVLLDVPVLNVEELDLEVEDLQAHVSVRAEVADLVNINIGVDARLDKVKLNIKGVEAQVQLKVRLERILGTLNSALAAIEQDPGIIDTQRRESRGLMEIEGSAGGTEGPESTPEPGAGAEVEATDAARRKAEELGVDLSRVEGTGSGGRVLLRDVREAAR